MVKYLRIMVIPARLQQSCRLLPVYKCIIYGYTPAAGVEKLYMQVLCPAADDHRRVERLHLNFQFNFYFTCSEREGSTMYIAQSML